MGGFFGSMIGLRGFLLAPALMVGILAGGPEAKAQPAGASDVLKECDRLTAPGQNSDPANPGVKIDWAHAVVVCQAAVDAEPAETHFHFALGKANYFAKNYIEAARHIRIAADVGNPDAQAALGVFYANGLGVIKNEQTAFDLYTKAAAGGSPTGMGLLGQAYVGKRDYGKALDWMEKAIEAGDSNSLREIGRMYFNGLGEPRDYAMAAQYYQQAVDLDDGYAMRFLANMYEVGFLGKPDLEKAAELRARAQIVDPDGKQADPISVFRKIYAANAGSQGGGGGRVRQVVHHRRYVIFRRRIFFGCIWRWC